MGLPTQRVLVVQECTYEESQHAKVLDVHVFVNWLSFSGMLMTVFQDDEDAQREAADCDEEREQATEERRFRGGNWATFVNENPACMNPNAQPEFEWDDVHDNTTYKFQWKDAT